MNTPNEKRPRGEGRSRVAVATETFTSNFISPDAGLLALDLIATPAEDHALCRLADGIDEPFTAIRVAWRAVAAAIREASLWGYGHSELRHLFAPTTVRSDIGDDAIVLVHRGGAA